MSLSLHYVTSDSELDEIIDCEWTSYETPHTSAWKIFYPIWGPSPSDRAAAIQESKERQLALHGFRAGVSNWIKVVDDSTGKVIGGAQWCLFDKDPYKNRRGMEMTCFWWPEGPKRKMADEMLGQLMGPRIERMSKPHLLLELCFVHPSHRRRGAGRLLVEWGTKKADELGVEAFVESTPDGRPLYESCGFVTMNGFELKPTLPEETEELKKLQRDLHFSGYFLWRPVRGVFEKGKTVVPWEKKA